MNWSGKSLIRRWRAAWQTIIIGSATDQRELLLILTLEAILNRWVRGDRGEWEQKSRFEASPRMEIESVCDYQPAAINVSLTGLRVE